MDDRALLKLMLKDRKNIQNIYKPTNYWACYERKMLFQIWLFGLKKLQKRESILSAFSYTTPFERFMLPYDYCHKHIDFTQINTLVELGSGCGRQVEIIKKRHPNICFLLFDMPPALYVCEQYLKSIFPDVVSYRETRDMTTMPRKKGIYIFGNWKFPIIKNIDLFWNAASFQEMEPGVVANYLKYVNKEAKNVFLQERMEGKELAIKKGKCGVLKKTTIEDYKRGLPDFKLVDTSPSVITKGCTNSFWKKD